MKKTLGRILGRRLEGWKTGEHPSFRSSIVPAALLLTVLFCFVFAFRADAEDVYSLFGKLFLSGRVEYDFTNRRNFLADTEEERVRQDNFDFDRLFRRGFHSVMVIEETAGSVKNILSLGEVPTTFTKFTFDQIDLSGGPLGSPIQPYRLDNSNGPGLVEPSERSRGADRRFRDRLTRSNKVRQVADRTFLVFP